MKKGFIFVLALMNAWSAHHVLANKKKKRAQKAIQSSQYANIVNDVAQLPAVSSSDVNKQGFKKDNVHSYITLDAHAQGHNLLVQLEYVGHKFHAEVTEKLKQPCCPDESCADQICDMRVQESYEKDTSVADSFNITISGEKKMKVPASYRKDNQLYRLQSVGLLAVDNNPKFKSASNNMRSVKLPDPFTKKSDCYAKKKPLVQREKYSKTETKTTWINESQVCYIRAEENDTSASSWINQIEHSRIKIDSKNDEWGVSLESQK